MNKNLTRSKISKSLELPQTKPLNVSRKNKYNQNTVERSKQRQVEKMLFQSWKRKCKYQNFEEKLFLGISKREEGAILNVQEAITLNCQ